MVTANKARDMVAHLSLAQAVGLRNRLDAFINEVPERWGDLDHREEPLGDGE